MAFLYRITDVRWAFPAQLAFHQSHTLHFYHHFTRPCTEYIIRLCVFVCRRRLAGGDQRSRISAHVCTCGAQQKKRRRLAVMTVLALLRLSSALERDDKSRCVALSHPESRLSFFSYLLFCLLAVVQTFAHNHTKQIASDRRHIYSIRSCYTLSPRSLGLLLYR